MQKSLWEVMSLKSIYEEQELQKTQINKFVILDLKDVCNILLKHRWTANSLPKNNTQVLSSTCASPDT